MSVRHKGIKIASNAVTGDTFPIGSIVEVPDGTPVPVGYEQVHPNNFITTKLSSNVTTVSAGYYNVIAMAQTNNVGTKLSVNGGKVKIGSGVSSIRAGAFIQYQRSQNGIFVFKIQRNRGGVIADISISAYNLTASENTVIVPEASYQVQENDEIQLVYNDLNVAGNSIRADGTYMNVEVIE